MAIADPASRAKGARATAPHAELATLVAQFGHKELAGGYHRGSWAGIALISGGGRVDFVDSYAFATSDAGPRPTEALFRAPYLREILESLDAPKSSARILFLSAGSRINEHKDPPINFQTGMLRLHLPLVTHPRHWKRYSVFAPGRWLLTAVRRSKRDVAVRWREVAARDRGDSASSPVEDPPVSALPNSLPSATTTRGTGRLPYSAAR